ncbi:MAG: UDP-N-acetylmuramoyl-L-alanyl-D-glutamate--2,6-diaminopimelate ligase [Gammaproteobacteria bacterium]|nr:UDP-N-acetylmuramoyl-L-alanyl-D-glutamate--2,6-diaminopimelate ligase [Gammaproteobacteria bacterium]
MTMTLADLLGRPDAPATVIGGLASDSRRVRPGDVFFAYRGSAYDGHDFVSDAVAAGAVAVVSERPVAVDVPSVVMGGVGRRIGDFARRFFDAPSGELDVVGVTGTNGKTTVAYNVARVAGTAAYMGTLGWGSPPSLCAADMTTADPITLLARLRALRHQGFNAVALEVSSHALDQGRVDAVDFAVGVFTNLGRDHLDYHGSVARYGAAKAKLFERSLALGAVVNADDALGRSIIADLPSGTSALSFGVDADVRWDGITYGPDGIAGRWRTPWGENAFTLPHFYGPFSVYNAAATLATCCLLGMPQAAVVDAMKTLHAVPGRMQLVARSPRVVVDYAHTPDALDAALQAVRSHVAGAGRVILVFGCGGDRDRGKRALMAQAAERGADLVIATSDNPRTESPERILDDVAAGFRAPQQLLRIADRRRAIATALRQAQTGDVVLLAGKGHERYQEVGGERVPFSDAAVAETLAARRRRQEPPTPRDDRNAT